MEIKASQSFPLWLTAFLSEYRVYKQSFSKYGKEYQMYLQGAYEAPEPVNVLSMIEKEREYARIYI
jgi:hypothetical protein